MERRRLNETLSELHQELQSTGELDTQTRELLAQLAGDINALLAHHDPATPTPETSEEAPHDKETLLERLSHLASDFEASHPTLASRIGRVADALSQWGI